MARKDILDTVVIASAQSLAASFQSTPTVVKYTDNVAYQIDITTTNSTGTFSVQGSLDYVPASINSIAVAGNWIDLSLSGGTPSAAAANDSILISLNQLPFSAVRISYTSTIAGTGTAAIRVMTKTVGA